MGRKVRAFPIKPSQSTARLRSGRHTNMTSAHTHVHVQHVHGATWYSTYGPNLNALDPCCVTCAVCRRLRLIRGGQTTRRNEFRVGVLVALVFKVDFAREGRMHRDVYYSHTHNSGIRGMRHEYVPSRRFGSGRRSRSY